MIDLIVFSRNRPLQLYAFLESLFEKSDVFHSAKTTVIFKYDEKFKEGLEEVKSKFSWANFFDQKDLKNDVLDVLKTSNKDYCMFFVDDIVVKDSISFSNICKILSSNPGILTFSLRMGLHLDFCYPTNSPQQIPDGMVKGGFFIWDWREGAGDWGYPMSVDGHAFRKIEILPWIERIDFSSPNQFEDFIQPAKNYLPSHHCICYASSKIINLPINRVQNEYKNRSEEIDADSLLEIWNKREKIDIFSLENIKNNSAHFPAKIGFIERS